MLGQLGGIVVISQPEIPQKSFFVPSLQGSMVSIPLYSVGNYEPATCLVYDAIASYIILKFLYIYIYFLSAYTQTHHSLVVPCCTKIVYVRGDLTGCPQACSVGCVAIWSEHQKGCIPESCKLLYKLVAVLFCFSLFSSITT